MKRKKKERKKLRICRKKDNFKEEKGKRMKEGEKM